MKSKSELPEQNILRAQLKLGVCFAEHNITFSLIAHLTKLLKDIFRDSQIAKDLRLGRIKLTEIVKNVN